SVSAGTTDTNTGNNSATDDDTLTPQVELSISKDDGKTSAVPGTADTYTITVSNTGPSDAIGATVSDNVPGALTGATWTCTPSSGSTCGSGTGDISETVAIRSGGTLTYTLTGTISASARGTLSNTASETPGAGETDTSGGNDSSNDTDTLTPQVNLAISKTDGKANAVPGTADTYTITVTNAGPSDALNATVTDNVPATLTGASWSCVASSGSSCGS